VKQSIDELEPLNICRFIYGTRQWPPVTSYGSPNSFRYIVWWRENRRECRVSAQSAMN